MKTVQKVLAAVITVFLLFALVPTAVSAAESGAEKIGISSIYVQGSNGKYYYFDQKITQGANKGRTYNLPDWMEECTVVFFSETGLKVECSKAEFKAEGNKYSAKVKLNGSSTELNVKLSKGSDTRELNLTLAQGKNDPLFKSIKLLNRNGVEETAGSGSVEQGYLRYDLSSGSTEGYTIRISAGQEQYVCITELTNVPEGESADKGSEVALKLISEDLCYEYQPVFVEGTNRFLVTVRGGKVEITCDITIIVGDANANLTTTTTTTTTTGVAESTTSSTTAATFPTEDRSDIINTLLNEGKDLPIMVWVLIGIIGIIIISACVYLIVSASSKDDDDDDDDYEDYDYEYGYRRVGANRGRSYEEEDYYPPSRGYERYERSYNDYPGGREPARGYDDYPAQRDSRMGYDRYERYDQGGYNGEQGYGSRSPYDNYSGYDSYSGYDRYSRGGYDDYAPRFPRREEEYPRPRFEEGPPDETTRYSSRRNEWGDN